MVDRRIITGILAALLLASTLSVITIGKNISLSVTGQVYDGRYSLHYPLFVTPIVNASQLHDEGAANQSARMDILLFVESNPGSHFRLICSSLGLCVGVVQYHVRRLEELGLVSSRRFGRYRRYFSSGVFDDSVMGVISMLRIGTVRDIVEVLLEAGSVRHVVLADRVDVSSQALTWYMKRLGEAGLVSSRMDENGLWYTVNFVNRDEIIRCLKILRK
ncbi:MAG: winged helix-turn-helix transcriptional regulator [Candidatus Bathyarchaeia archaeon]|jgi:predicted transcriptional regulator